MAMDDPWGSPWADEIQAPHPVKLKEVDFAVKPTTPAKAASLALEQKTNSPWDDADDDGFGDWNAGSAEEEKDLGLDAGDDGWKSNTGVGLGPGLTIKGSHASLASWNNGAITPEDGAPKLGPSPFPKPAEILRQPSPDPWAVDTGREDKPAEAATVPADHHDERSIHDEPILDLSAEKEIIPDAAPVVVHDGVLPETIGTRDGIPGEREAKGTVEESSSNVESIETLKPVEKPEYNGDIPDAEHVSSRPSSSPSEHSHHDETVQESPRTSLDEEPKRPPVARKVSTKVQELVEHFDGLAKQEEVAAPIMGRTGSPGGKTENVGAIEIEEDEEEDDFGDFEDVQSEPEEAIGEGKADSPAKSPIVEESNANTREPLAAHEEPQSSAVRKDLGPVEFTIDLSALDQLYSASEAKPPSEKAFIPDIVPHDSFASTEERKTWYRISRYGTMRKYNAGDDENYIRVNWTQSQARAETLKIVARWIEEDRISGRVVLGGVSKGSSIFGWNDSKAAPVPLAAAFAVKNGKQKAVPVASESVVEIPREWPKGLMRTRSTSRTPSLSKSRRESSTESPASEDIPKPAAQLPVANFGWNDTPHGTQEPFPHSPVHGKKLSGSSSGTLPPAANIPLASQLTASRTSSPLAEPRKRIIPTNGIAPRPHSIAHTIISKPPSLTTSNTANDDDDWGELVSSPSTNIPPVLPPPSKSLHKTTGSLGSSFPPTAPIPQLTSAHSQLLKPEQTGGLVSGSNEVLAPKITKSATTNTPNTFNHSGLTTSNTDHMNNAFSPATQIAHQPLRAASADPWASADFSFFETSTAAPVSKAVPPPAPQLMPPESVTFSTPALMSITPQNQKSREELEKDRIVQSVVKGLPDLSYMLRK